ncbi:MAG: hypothetical protein RH859_02400 [Longimicrobiales bacterium]
MTRRPSNARNRLPRPVLVLAAAAALAGCGETADPNALSMVDSAGVAVVTAPRTVMEALPTWTTESVLELGSADGPDAFGGVLGVHRYADGSVAVLDPMARQVAWFAPDGTPGARVGSEGDGPAEFRTPVRLDALPGDSLLVWDRSLNRVSVIGPDRTVARTAPLAEVPTSGLYRGRLADGRLIFDVPDTDRPTATAPVMRDTRLRLHAPDGTVSTTLGPFPSVPWYRMGEEGYGTPVYAPATDFAAAGDGIWVGPAASPEVVQVTTDGTLRRIVRWGAPERPVTQALRDRSLEMALSRANSDAERAEIRRLHEGLYFAPRLPFYRRVFTAADGGLWVEGYNPDPSAEPTEWRVFDAEGRPLARLELPGSFRLWEAGSDHLAGTVSGDMEVPRVVIWRIVRS